MTTEMDVLHMDERQRLAWLMANRGTVIAVGSVWIGMIVWELARGSTPLFLILMVPVFALLRLGLFFFYLTKPVDLGGRKGGRGLVPYVKIGAALLLVAALGLPLYSIGVLTSRGADRRYGFVWELARDDPAAIAVLAPVFLWPVVVLLLAGWVKRGWVSRLVPIAEPFLAAASSVVVLWIPKLMFEFQVVFVLLLPAPARPELGCYLAVLANGLYFVGWLAEALRPWVKRPEAKATATAS